MGDEVVARRRLFEERLDWVVSSNEARRPEPRCTCPCCGYPTLADLAGYEIRELCDWEDDGQDDPYADKLWGGPNGGYSLSGARQNFARSLSMYGPELLEGDDHAGDTPSQARAKRAAMEAFEAMIDGGEPSVRSALWERVNDAEGELARESMQKVREYGARIERRKGV